MPQLRPVRPLIRPPRLAPGARVAIVAPSGPVPEDRLAAGVDVLRGWDLEPVVAPHALDRHPALPYLAGTDEDRARDLQDAWCDPAIDAVLCARGGYGAQRVIELLDWDRMSRSRRKPFVGFSDITALHEAFAVRTGLSTLHGPMAAGADFLKSARAQEHLRATLFAPETVRCIAPPTARALAPGRATGVTFGGTVSLLAAELGSPQGRPTARGGLLMIEDIGEDPYRLDRILTQLLRADWLAGVRGIALGSWEDCGSYDDVRTVLLDRLGGLGVPVVEHFGFGHGAGALTIPLGIEGELNADTGELLLSEPALV